MATAGSGAHGAGWLARLIGSRGLVWRGLVTCLAWAGLVAHGWPSWVAEMHN